MSKQEMVRYVRSQSFLMGDMLNDWTDEEVFNLGYKNWCLEWNGN